MQWDAVEMNVHSARELVFVDRKTEESSSASLPKYTVNPRIGNVALRLGRLGC